MEIFYHFSHFLEILTGIYFGGFALLSFASDGASKSIYSKINKREEDAASARILATEYFKVKSTTPDDGTWQFIKFNSLWIFYCWTYRAYKRIANRNSRRFKTKHLDLKIIAEKEETILKKKFFPSFFFAGCFCMSLILISAIQAAAFGSQKFHTEIDVFMIYYLISAFGFQIWSLFFFPYRVNRHDYIHLIVLNITICFILFLITIIQSFTQFFPTFLHFFFVRHHEMRLIEFMVIVALFPLLYIIFSIAFIIFSWEIPIFFDAMAQKIFASAVKSSISNLKAEGGQ